MADRTGSDFASSSATDALTPKIGELLGATGRVYLNPDFPWHRFGVPTKAPLPALRVRSRNREQRPRAQRRRSVRSGSRGDPPPDEDEPDDLGAAA